MQITIDLSQLFCENEDPCDLQAAVRDEVVRSLTKTMGERLTHTIEQETRKVINAELQKAVQERMPQIVDSIIDAPFTPVDSYGSAKGPTTFRNALAKEILSQMVYKKVAYDGDKNVFTRAIDSVIEENLKLFKAEMKKQVDAQYTAAVLQAATEALRQRLGIKP
jgi:dGTP triphosphohydrolase